MFNIHLNTKTSAEAADTGFHSEGRIWPREARKKFLLRPHQNQIFFRNTKVFLSFYSKL